MLVPILLLCFATHANSKSHAKRGKLPVELPKDLDKLVEIEDKPFQRPVDFLHLYREGYGDKDYKQPIHLLESDMIKPMNNEHAIQLLEKSNKNNVQWLPNTDAIVFNSPRDELMYYKKMYEPGKKTKAFDNKDQVYDFLTMLERNLAYPVINMGRQDTVKNKTNERLNQATFEDRRNISELFEENGFGIKLEKRSKENWTTCEEFSKKSLFHHHDIVNTAWIPFYIWSRRSFSTSVVHRFVYPTKKRVNYYKTSFGPYIDNIDWSKPKLLLQERREFLLISSTDNGLFYGIPDQEPPTPEQGNVKLPVIILRLKIHSPYIAMMYCNDFYATVMAELGTEPATDDDKIREATTLGFRGKGLPVYQDIETERILTQVDKMRQRESEQRKTIKISKMVADVDYAVRH